MKKTYHEPVILALLVVIAAVTVAAVKHVPVKKFDSVYTAESADSDEEPSLVKNDTPVTTQSKITRPF